MLKALVRSQIRRQIDQLNRGNAAPILALAAPDAELCFPGNNSYSAQFRTPPGGSRPYATHRGPVELEAFANRFVAAGLRIEIEDILVNGPPWRTRIALRGTDAAIDDTGAVVYENRIVAFIEARWGKIHRWEDYLDTEKVRGWDELIAATGRAPAATLS
jgi:ketosteroid isomerase-like protein